MLYLEKQLICLFKLILKTAFFDLLLNRREMRDLKKSPKSFIFYEIYKIGILHQKRVSVSLSFFYFKQNRIWGGSSAQNNCEITNTHSYLLLGAFIHVLSSFCQELLVYQISINPHICIQVTCLLCHYANNLPVTRRQSITLGSAKTAPKCTPLIFRL